MLSTLLLALAFCIVAVLVYMARYSGRVRVTQTRVIDAHIEAVWRQVADFAHWNDWNPWVSQARDARGVSSGAIGDLPQNFDWDIERIGTGHFDLRAAQPASRIEQRFKLKHPFGVHGKSFWTLSEDGGKTEVSWTLQGRVSFSMRAFATTVTAALVLDCRHGLARLAQSLEPADASRYSLHPMGVVDVSACRYVYQTCQGAISQMPELVQQAITELQQALATRQVLPCGAPIAVYVETQIKTRRSKCHAGIPVDVDAEVGDVPVRDMPAHKALQMRLEGSTEALEVAWYHAMQSLSLQGLRPDPRIPPFERYDVAATSASRNEAVTELHLAIVRQA